VTELLRLRRAQLLAAAACCGLAFANVLRMGPGVALFTVVLVAAFAVAAAGLARFVLTALALLLVAWLWGSARLDVLDSSPLELELGRAAAVRLTVTAPARRGLFDVRVFGSVSTFANARIRERVLLRLPRGRAPPQGAILEAVAVVMAPRAPKNGFDERTWLRRQGIHVVLRSHKWRIVGHRGGIGGIADALRRRLARSVAIGLTGERMAVVEGVVLGEDAGLSQDLRDRFRASGLYHLLAVSGQNVALVAGSALLLAWVAGIPRLLAEVGALLAICAYVLAVGAQPSVVRAGIAGALGSLAWLTARTADRWHLLLVGALVLLAWNPYTLLDAGFQLSFAAVLAIFVLVPRFERFLEGYPLGKPLRLVVAVSAACGLATAPISWLHFHSIQLLTIPANALAAPVVVPLLGLALAGAAITPVSAGTAATLSSLNGWCAAYLVAVARLVGGLPFSQVKSTPTLLVFLAGALLIAAYACPRWPRTSSSPST
jgi:competence protein ComEC